MKDVVMLAKDVAMLGRTLLHVKSLIATENAINAINKSKTHALA